MPTAPTVKGRAALCPRTKIDIDICDLLRSLVVSVFLFWLRTPCVMKIGFEGALPSFDDLVDSCTVCMCPLLSFYSRLWLMNIAIHRHTIWFAFFCAVYWDDNLRFVQSYSMSHSSYAYQQMPSQHFLRNQGVSPSSEGLEGLFIIEKLIAQFWFPFALQCKIFIKRVPLSPSASASAWSISYNWCHSHFDSLFSVQLSSRWCLRHCRRPDDVISLGCLDIFQRRSPYALGIHASAVSALSGTSLNIIYVNQWGVMCPVT